MAEKKMSMGERQYVFNTQWIWKAKGLDSDGVVSATNEPTQFPECGRLWNLTSFYIDHCRLRSFVTPIVLCHSDFK